MIAYIENPKDSMKNLLEIISEFSKVTGYKINTQKNQYTDNESMETKIKRLFITTANKIKYLGIN